MAIIGTTVMNGLTGYSPWFRRAGDKAVFSMEVIGLSAAGTLDVEVQHKNDDETTHTVAGSFAQLNSTGVDTLDVSDLKQNVRFQYIAGGTNLSDWVHFRAMSPAWYS